MTANGLIDAINAAPGTPCERYSCSHKTDCASGMACAAYVFFVRTGRCVHPGSNLPDMGMKNPKRSELEIGTIRPSKAAFDLIESMEDEVILIEGESEDVIANAVLNRSDLEVAFNEALQS